MGRVFESIELLTAEFILECLVDKLNVAKWEALVTSEGFADNCTLPWATRSILHLQKTELKSCSRV